MFWRVAAAAAAKLLQSCPTLCNPRDGSLPGSPVPGILQARTLEWVAVSFSNAWNWKVKVRLLSCVRLFPNPWTAAYQAPLSMGFSRQEYWSGVPLPSPFRGLVICYCMKLDIFMIYIHSHQISLFLGISKIIFKDYCSPRGWNTDCSSPLFTLCLTYPANYANCLTVFHCAHCSLNPG